MLQTQDTGRGKEDALPAPPVACGPADALRLDSTLRNSESFHGFKSSSLSVCCGSRGKTTGLFGGGGARGSVVSTLCDPWTAVHQAPLSMKLPRQEYWSGLPRAPPGDRPHPGIGSCVSCLGRQLLFHGATWEAARGPQSQTPYSQAGVPTSSTPTARLGSPHPDPLQPGWGPHIQHPYSQAGVPAFSTTYI